MNLRVSIPLLRGQHALYLYEATVVDNTLMVTSALPSLPFSHTGYSQFKYGRRDTAETFGAALAELLVPHLEPVLAAGEETVVIGTPYKRLPNAAHMLAITAERLLRAAGLPTSYSCIYQHRLAAGDYGKLSSEERDQRNRLKKRCLDPDDFIGRHVVVIDDVRITGSIERSIMAMLAGIDVLSVTIVNLVRLDPVVAQERPQLEDELNHYAMHDLRDLLRLMEERDRFTLTTRAVKYILQSDPDEVSWLLKQLDQCQIAELYQGIVEEGYDRMTCYRETFGLIGAVRNS